MQEENTNLTVKSEEQSERELKRTLKEIEERSKKPYQIEQKILQHPKQEQSKIKYKPGLSESVIEKKPTDEINKFISHDPVHTPVGKIFDKYHNR